jgi:hypothetical protein
MNRWGSKGNQRKPAEQLFFNRSLGNPLSYDDIGGYRSCLENLRLAPSASNKQPWRIILTAEGFHFFLDRDPLYSKLIPRVDLQRIDMGIAQFHFEQTAREQGLEIKRYHQKPDLDKLPGNFEYMTSYKTADLTL